MFLHVACTGIAVYWVIQEPSPEPLFMLAGQLLLLCLDGPPIERLELAGRRLRLADPEVLSRASLDLHHSFRPPRFVSPKPD